MYKRDKPWKTRFVIPIERKNKKTKAAIVTSIDEKDISKGKKNRLDKGLLYIIKGRYKALSKKSAISNKAHYIEPDKDKEYIKTNSKIKTNELKEIRKHVKK